MKSTHKNQLHFYTLTVSFPGAPKRIKYLGIDLTKEAKGLNTDCYKMCSQKLKKIQINGNIQCSWIGRLGVVTMTIPTKVT